MNKLRTEQESMIDQYVGNKIRVIRNSLCMSQTDLAQKVGLTFQQMQKYENGKNRVAVSRLIMIARALKRPVSYFLPADEKIEIDTREFIRVEKQDLDSVINKLISIRKKKGGVE